MSYADCAAAVAEANEAGPEEPLQVNAILSLQSVVEQLTALDDPTVQFAFTAPSRRALALASTTQYSS